jgi:hypothetical protein
LYIFPVATDSPALTETELPIVDVVTETVAEGGLINNEQPAIADPMSNTGPAIDMPAAGDLPAVEGIETSQIDGPISINIGGGNIGVEGGDGLDKLKPGKYRFSRKLGTGTDLNIELTVNRPQSRGAVSVTRIFILTGQSINIQIHFSLSANL